MAVALLVTALVACGGDDGPARTSVVGPFAPAARYALRRGSDVLLVQHRGRPLAQVAASGWGVDRPHRLASGTKSFAGVLGVAAAGAGLLSLDERAADTLTEWRGDPRKSRITVRELLDQSSGLDPKAGLPAADAYRAGIEAPVVHEPGTTFDYGPNHFNAFAALVQRKLRARGLGDDPLAYLERVVLRPIGLRVAGWDRDARGQPLFATGADLSARQWAKLGRLVAQHGRWNGRAVLPAALVDEMLAPSVANSRYGLGWWLDPGPELEDHTPIPGVPNDLAMAAGAGDQRLYVVRSRSIVIVRFGEDERFEDREFLRCAFTTACLR